MISSLVKRERLWYTDAMKALLLHLKRIMFGLMILLAACSLGCAPLQNQLPEDRPEYDGDEECEADTAIIFPMYSAAGDEREETFVCVAASAHAVAYVSAHAIEAGRAQELLDCFENTIWAALPATAG